MIRERHQLPAMPPDEATDGRPEKTVDDELIVTAKLAEYEALQKEVSDRGGYQQQILQIHVTAMTVIAGAALSREFSPLILLVIPFESSICGMLWFSQAVFRRHIRAHIMEHNENVLSSLLGSKHAPSWETLRPQRQDKNPRKRLWDSSYQAALNWTFRIPGLAVVAASGVTTILIFPWPSRPNWLEELADDLKGALHVTIDHDLALSLLLLVLTGLAVGICYQFNKIYEEYWNIRRSQETSQRNTTPTDLIAE